ncbi:hypothetical protein IC582_008615 [Cucumis melo]|uniref:Uncharacterized protein LOC103502982 n=2 Tax=Cucumis melo TaxID=3656 RepID=A0A1S3CNK0_CUCME|nr:uncharacterized protein LOC103502982 [Cucumis melo]KAA0051262.1 HNH endonuclease [Cucumis melo var. makuwa]TYK29998.1 HNH endonuclease [Cucumis melo var. makuwa]
MAQFTAHSRVKLLLNGDGLPCGSESKDRFRYKLRSVRARRFPLSAPSSSTSSTSALRKSTQHAAEVRVGVRDESVTGGDDAIVGFDYDYEFESDDLACFRGLVLDISYRPVNVVCWKRAICLEFMEKADVLEYYDQTVNSPSGSFYIPAVLRVPHLLQVVKRRRIKNSLSRKNILYRDNYTCQYCSSHESLTIDHVLPISRGGEWTWENLVAACVKCNSKKGQKTVEEANMKLKKTPKAPKDYDILAIPLTSTAIKMLKLRKGTPEEWRQYLSSEQ